MEFKKIKFKEDLESKLNEKKVEIKNKTKKIWKIYWQFFSFKQ